MARRKFAAVCPVMAFPPLPFPNPPGTHFCTEGQFEVTKDGEFLTLVGVGQVMGELAILYKCQRTASVQGLW